ncbi:MAG TPA: diheme cytochrome c-553, partial [Thermoanaerobaculia bacterium]
MNKRITIIVSLVLAALVLTATLTAATSNRAAAREQQTAEGAAKARVKRGEYLVTIGGCNDCHTPFKMGPKGPEPDMSRRLSGHPDSLKMPPAPSLGKNTPWVW